MTVGYLRRHAKDPSTNPQANLFPYRMPQILVALLFWEASSIVCPVYNRSLASTKAVSFRASPLKKSKFAYCGKVSSGFSSNSAAWSTESTSPSGETITTFSPKYMLSMVLTSWFPRTSTSLTLSLGLPSLLGLGLYLIPSIRSLSWISLHEDSSFLPSNSPIARASKKEYSGTILFWPSWNSLAMMDAVSYARSVLLVHMYVGRNS